jgi:hypothetical protein
MAKSVPKEGYKMFSFYIKKSHLEKIRNKADKEDRTITSIINKYIENGVLEVQEKDNKD